MSFRHAPDPECIFCRVMKGEIPCFKLAETEHAICFLDIYPTSEGHAVIIPKEHAPNLQHVSDEAMKEIGPMMVKVARGLNAENYNVLQNNGVLAHQEIMHAHFHIIPKTTQENGLGVKWRSHKGDHEKLERIAGEIRARMEQQ